MSREWIAVGVVIAASAAFVLGWSMLRDRAVNDAVEDRGIDRAVDPSVTEDATDPAESTPPSESPPSLRRDETRLRARIAEMEGQLEAESAPADNDTPVLSAPRPAFRVGVTPDDQRARFLAPHHWTSLEREEFGDADLVLELESGRLGTLLFVGRQGDDALTASLTEVAQRLLLNRYARLHLVELFVLEEQDRGHYSSFSTLREAEDHVRMLRLADDSIVVREESGYRLIDLRPTRQLPKFIALEGEYQEGVAEAKRLDPTIFGASIRFTPTPPR